MRWGRYGVLWVTFAPNTAEVIAIAANFILVELMDCGVQFV
jgi:hypothetical protein